MGPPTSRISSLGFFIAELCAAKAVGENGSFWAGAAWEDAAAQHEGRPQKTWVLSGQPCLGRGLRHPETRGTCGESLLLPQRVL